MYDGRVVFKVDLNTKDFSEQMEKTKDELDDLMKEYMVWEKTANSHKMGTSEARYVNRQLTELGAKIQETANKYDILKKKQDAVLNDKRAKSLASIKNIESAYVQTEKKFALQRGSYSKQTFGISEIKGELPYISKDLEDLSKGVENVGKQEDNASKKSKTFGETMNKSFKKGLKSVTKLALGIIGIHSAYMLARRAASAYMSQDEEITKKIQSAWIGLGAFLAPFLEWFSEIMLKAVGYLNEFIKALTGNDYIARANAKALEKQAKAQSNLNKEMQKYQQYDFDVIRTQQDMSSYNVGSSSSDTSGLIDIPPLDEGIIKKLQDLAQWLKDNKDLIEAVGIALGITFGAVAIGNLLANIGALIGSGALLTGLAGLAAILGILAITWSIKVVIDGLNDLKEANEISEKLAKNLTELMGKGSKMATDENAPEEVPEYFQSNFGNLGYYISQYAHGAEDVERQRILRGILGEATSKVFDVGTSEKNKLKEYTKQLKASVVTHIQLAKQGKLTEEGYKNLIYFVMLYGNDIGKLNKEVSEYNINQEDLNQIMRDYANVYPNVVDNMEEFNDTQKQQIKQAMGVTDSIIGEKDAVDNLGDSVNDLPKEHNIDINTNTENAKNNIIEIGKGLSGLTKTVPITVDFKTKTDVLKEKLRKLADVIEFLLPGNMGYIAKNSLLRSLDYFATGGYVSQPTLAVVGEGKTRGEYMIPDGEDYISRLAAEIGQYSGGNGITNVYLDGRLIQRQMNKTTDRINFVRNGR